MNRLAILAVGAAALAAAGEARASIYTDELSKCLVAKSSTADRTLLVQWVFGSMSVHPAVKDVVEAKEPRRRQLSGEAARLYERLMAEDCRSETVAAVRHDGVGAIQASFAVLGETAMKDLMAHPAVLVELDALARALDPRRMDALMREAAGPVPPRRSGTR